MYIESRSIFKTLIPHYRAASGVMVCACDNARDASRQLAYSVTLCPFRHSVCGNRVLIKSYMARGYIAFVFALCKF